MRIVVDADGRMKIAVEESKPRVVPANKPGVKRRIVGTTAAAKELGVLRAPKK